MAELKPLRSFVGDTPLLGVDELRRMVRNFNNCRESFNQAFSLENLVRLHRAWMASGVDIHPDEWTGAQVYDAIEGYVPQWDPCTDLPIVLTEHAPYEDPRDYESGPWMIRKLCEY